MHFLAYYNELSIYLFDFQINHEKRSKNIGGDIKSKVFQKTNLGLYLKSPTEQESYTMVCC